MPKLCAMTTLHALANTHKSTWRGEQQHVLPIYLLTQNIDPQQNIDLSTLLHVLIHTIRPHITTSCAWKLWNRIKANENLNECDLTKISNTVGLTAKLFRSVLV